MKTASTSYCCEPQKWVTSNIAEHIEKFGVPAVKASVTVTATLKAWESIRSLRSDGNVDFNYETGVNISLRNSVRHVLEHKLKVMFLDRGVVPESIDITDLISEVFAEEEQKKAARAEADRIRDEERLQNEARVKNEKAMLKKEMGEWILTHGSERLRLCFEEDIDCEAAYRDERIEAERPGWWWDSGLSGSSKDPRNPPIEAFDVLREARKLEPEAVLYFHTENGFYVEDEDGERTGEEVDNWHGYVAHAKFLGKEIVFGVPEEYWK